MQPNEAQQYEIQFTEQLGRCTGGAVMESYYEYNTVAEWHAVLWAYTAADALTQFNTEWKGWRKWPGLVKVLVRSVRPFTVDRYPTPNVQLERPDKGASLWRDAVLTPVAGDPK
jgi:hypothetical protein